MTKRTAYYRAMAMGLMAMGGDLFFDDEDAPGHFIKRDDLQLDYTTPPIERNYPKYGTKGRFHRLAKQRHATEIRINVRTEPKTGRNDPCTCGSGMKYKKCCIT